MKATRVIVVAALVFALCVSTALAQSDADCQKAAQQLRSSPEAAAFKSCAAAGPKPGFKKDCCSHLSAFSQYAGCLSNSAYQSEANSFLSGATTLSEAASVCGGGRRMRRARTAA